MYDKQLGMWVQGDVRVTELTTWEPAFRYFAKWKVESDTGELIGHIGETSNYWVAESVTGELDLAVCNSKQEALDWLIDMKERA